MEHLHPKNFTCTNIIDIKTNFSKFVRDLKDFNNSNASTVSTNNAQELETNDILGVPVSKEALKKLKSVCSVPKLTHKDQVPQTNDFQQLWVCSEFESATDAGGHLQTQKVKENWENVNERTQVFSIPFARDLEDVDEADLVPREDILVIVRLFKPYVYSPDSPSNQARYTHEIAILGRHTLADLRDQFKCVHDLSASIELEYPVDAVISDQKEDYPSGFIFIENCFYNDMRHPNAFEYSKEIIEWATKKNIAKFTSNKMENVKIIDLKLRIGYPYVYQHQGNCQHIVVFKEIRLLRPDEQLNSSKYPYIYSVNHFNTSYCIICKHEYAKFIVTDCERLINKYNYLCKKCLLSYNYKDEKKIGSFKLYPYYDVNLILNRSN